MPAGRLLADRRGVAVIVFALSAPLLLGCAGLGVDVVFWYRDVARMQQIADRAAISGSGLLAAGGTPAAAAAVASAVATADGEAGFNVAAGIPSAGPHAGDPLAIEVTLVTTQPRFFSRLFLDGDGALGARAVALAKPKAIPAARLVE